MVASLGYQGSKSRHLLVQSNFNVIAGANGIAPNPIANSIDYYANTGSGNYNAMIATLKHTFSHQFNIETQYTWGKAMDENSGPYQPALQHKHLGRPILQGQRLWLASSGRLHRRSRIQHQQQHIHADHQSELQR
jgi:hypothetical protein